MAKNNIKPKEPQGKDKKKKKKESAWEFTRSMIILLGLVIIVKWFVCDIFFIPSGSMEQTLHGHPDNGDRIFCTKLNYLWRTPERWEVFVFKFPYMQTSEGESSTYKGEHFIKRCVGLPGESLALVGGDVFIKDKKTPEPTRQVKGDRTQKTLWIPVYNEDFKDINLSELEYYWNITEEEASSVSIRDKSLQITANKGKVFLTFKPHTRFGPLAGIPDRYVRRQVVEFSCPVMGCDGRARKTVSTPKMTARCPRCGEYLQESDVISYDYRTGYPANYHATFNKVAEVADPQYRGEWWHFVPDLSIASRASFNSTTSSIKYIIESDKTTYSALYTNTSVKIYKDTQLLEEYPFAIDQDEENEITFSHLDGRLRGHLNGQLAYDISADDEILNPREKAPEKTNIRLEITGNTTISSLNINRDIYYYNYRDSKDFFTLPDDGYMALGDNCPSSNDSRFWGPVPADNLVGTAQFIWWPLHAIKALH